MDKRLVEEWLPLRELNENTRREMGFIRVPKISNLHLWLARRPCSMARALTLTSILPHVEESVGLIKKLLGLTDLEGIPFKIIYLVNPELKQLGALLKKTLDIDSDHIVIVDPMAGGGSIPLEALRLGFRSIAIEYNPVAYIILKATLEYPARFGKDLRLYEEVRKEAKALIEYAGKELGKYYAPDAYMRHIFARGVTCPNAECQGLIPIIHSTRLGRDGPYMKLDFDRVARTFNVSIVNYETDFEKLKCPYCGRPLTQDEVFKGWVSRHRRLLEIALSGDIDEAKKNVEDLLGTHILLLKQVRRGFSPCDDTDRRVFVEAYIDLAKQAKELKSYIPDAPIPNENEVFKPIKEWGISKWYELFNPRQLLIMSKLTKYVTERAEELIGKEGEYGAAVATYLALGLDKTADYNNIATMWDQTQSSINRLGDQYAAKKSIGLGLEYCEFVILPEEKSFGWIYEPDVEKPTATRGGICPVIRELCIWLGEHKGGIEVYNGDARELATIMGEVRADLINVDPPYFDQHIYSDLFEYFWQFLRLSLKPVIDSGYLFNRDESRGRVECFVTGWSPILPTLPRGGEIIVRKGKSRLEQTYVPHSRGWYTEQMWRFFTEARKTLRDDGILIVWFTHSDPEAWESILSGLYASDFLLTRVWTIATEAERFIGRISGFMFLTSMAIVARKGGERILVGENALEALASNIQVREAVQRSVDEALQSARQSGASDREAFIMALAGGIAGATKIHNPSVEMLPERDASLNSYTGKPEELAKLRFRRVSSFFKDKLYPVAMYLAVNRVLEEKVAEIGLAKDYLEDIVGADNHTKAYILLWLSTRYADKPIIEYDFAEKICKVAGLAVDGLRGFGLLRVVESNRKKLLQVPYGEEVFEALRNRLELLNRTTAGSAIFLTRVIAEAPSAVKEDVSKWAEYVMKVNPASRQVIATALFLLRTAKEDELRGLSVTKESKPFIDKVLQELYGR